MQNSQTMSRRRRRRRLTGKLNHQNHLKLNVFLL